MLRTALLAGFVACALLPVATLAVELDRNVADLMAEAKAAVPAITPEDASEMLKDGRAVLIDVRDAPELAETGMIAGAHHIPRGMIEFRADPATRYFDPILNGEKTVILYCASGSRSALAGKTLKDMGFAEVYNVGGISELVAAGMSVVPSH